jgi:hypothetical protein
MTGGKPGGRHARVRHKKRCSLERRHLKQPANAAPAGGVANTAVIPYQKFKGGAGRRRSVESKKTIEGCARGAVRGGELGQGVQGIA